MLLLPPPLQLQHLQPTMNLGEATMGLKDFHLYRSVAKGAAAAAAAADI